LCQEDGWIILGASRIVAASRQQEIIRGALMKRTTVLSAVMAGMAAISLSACTDNDAVNAATGAVIGGAVGSQIGGGRGNTLATATGVAAGAVIGANANKNKKN
jgi:outer membrane lipoprotein SlyB